jgi:hypothetical protein
LSPGGKEATVEYRKKFEEKTPFGKTMKINYNFLKKARFVLYDDGWQMVENR